MSSIRRMFVALVLLLALGVSASMAAEPQGRHFPFTAEEDADGARYVWWAMGKTIGPYRYVPARLIPGCGAFAPSPDGKTQPADLAWWKEFVALYMGDSAPAGANLLTGRGKMSLKDLQRKYGPVKWYRYLVPIPRSEPPKEKLVTLDDVLNRLSPTIGMFPPTVQSMEELAAVKTDWHNAEREFLLVLQAYPASEEIEWRLGELYRFGHNMDMNDAWVKSEAHFTKALEISPWSIPSLLGLGLLYVNTDFEKAAKAEPLFKEAIMVSYGGETPADAYSGLFFSYYYQGRLSAAIEAANEYLELKPNDREMEHLRDMARDKARQSKK